MLNKYTGNVWLHMYSNSMFIIIITIVFIIITFSIKYCIGPKNRPRDFDDLHVLRVTESEKVIFGMSSICL